MLTTSNALLALLAFAAGAALMYFLRATQQAKLAAELRELQNRLQEHSVTEARQQERLLAAAELEKQATALRTKLEGELREAQQAVHARDRRMAELDARLSAEREQLNVQMQFVKTQEQSLKLQFEQLATRIFEEKSQKFSEQNKSGLDGLLSPLREQLKEFREKVETTYQNEARERFALKEEITRLESLNRQISDDAGNLARALKGDKKMQGNWGEVILVRVLEESGLRKDHEYITQFSVRNDEGQLRIPDAIVRLPEGRDIIIDSKVSLNDYVLYCAAEDADERDRLLRLHTTAVRNHIRTLSDKRYEDLPELRTLDFVFLFMPVEAAFMLAVEQDPALFREAFDSKIIIVSPTTLLATLRTVESIWRYERQNVNAEKIAKEAGNLHDKFVTLIGHLENLGRAIERSREAYDQSLAGLKGHGGLLGRVDKLRQLGAKTKKTVSLASVEAALDALPLAGDESSVVDETDTENAE
jgi:DNA recombination protein RmuC